MKIFAAVVVAFAMSCGAALAADGDATPASDPAAPVAPTAAPAAAPDTAPSIDAAPLAPLPIVAPMPRPAPAAEPSEPGPPPRLDDASFDAQFQCPETITDADARIDEYARYAAWAKETHPDWTFKKRLDVRYGLLRRHACATTIAGIASSGRRPFGL